MRKPDIRTFKPRVSDLTGTDENMPDRPARHEADFLCRQSQGSHRIVRIICDRGNTVEQLKSAACKIGFAKAPFSDRFGVEFCATFAHQCALEPRDLLVRT